MTPRGASPVPRRFRAPQDAGHPLWHRAAQNPLRVIGLSFLAVILIGAVLLSLPLATRSGTATPFLHALFTATSATCVTGLIIYDTATHWSLFGSTVLLSLIQIGGLGLITITAFFTVTLHRKLAYRTSRVVQESMGAESLPDTRRILRRVVVLTVTFEAFGAVLLAWRFSARMPWPRAVYRGIFHSVSAFCNAGFDLMGDVDGPFSSLTGWQADPIVLPVTALLILIGGLGFIVWMDLPKVRRTRTLRFHSRIVLWMTLMLTVGGTVYFLLVEGDNAAPGALGALPVAQRPLAAFFQSVTLRTAGFNAIDQAILRPGSKFVSVLLMFIGASPASTGGGLKTTTMVLVLATGLADLRGREEAVVLGHRIPRAQSKRAFVLFLLGILLTSVTVLILSFTEHRAIVDRELSFIDLLFETVSAFATVGVTSVGTGSLRTPSLYPLMLLMYLGRVGPASFAMGLVMRGSSPTPRVYPEGRILIG